MQGYYYEDDEYEEMIRRQYEDPVALAFWSDKQLLVKLPFLRSLPFYRNLYGWKK